MYNVLHNSDVETKTELAGIKFFSCVFMEEKERDKQRQGHVQQSWPDKDTLSLLRCVTFLIFFFVSLYFSFRKVWQKRYCIAKEGMFTLAHSPVRIFSINSKILQVSLIGLLVWLTQKRLFCKRQYGYDKSKGSVWDTGEPVSRNYSTIEFKTFDTNRCAQLDIIFIHWTHYLYSHWLRAFS